MSTAPASIPEAGAQIYEQEVVVNQPALWSLEERNLYKLVTDVEAGGGVVDRYETPFGIRTVSFDAEKGFFLNGKSVKLKGTCNHQDHAGRGRGPARRRAVLPRPQASRDGLQRLTHIAQPSHFGTARRLRRAGDAGVR